MGIFNSNASLPLGNARLGAMDFLLAGRSRQVGLETIHRADDLVQFTAKTERSVSGSRIFRIRQGNIVKNELPRSLLRGSSYGSSQIISV